MITDAPTVHRDMMTRPGFTQLGSVVQLGPLMPNQPRNSLTRPLWPLRSISSSTPTATGGVILGRKNAVRKKPAACPARCSSRARASDSTSWAGTAIAV